MCRTWRFSVLYMAHIRVDKKLMIVGKIEYFLDFMGLENKK